MKTTDKPRSDSALKTLPDDRQSEIADFALSHTLADTVTWLSANGVEPSSAALSRFLSWYNIMHQLTQNESAVQQILTEFKAQTPAISPNELNEIGHRFFTALALEKRDPRAWYLARQIACRKAEIQLEFQKYTDAVQARKEAIQRELDAARSAGGLSPETIEKIERELNLF